MVKNPPANAGDVGLILALGRYPAEGNDNPLQYSCLGNPMNRGTWQAIAHWVTKTSDLIKQQALCFKTEVCLSADISDEIHFQRLSSFTCSHFSNI